MYLISNKVVVVLQPRVVALHYVEFRVSVTCTITSCILHRSQTVNIKCRYLYNMKCVQKMLCTCNYKLKVLLCK